MSITNLDNEFVASTYGRFPLELREGMGSVAYDTEGHEYIDMGTGIAVNTFGFSDTEWVIAVTEQLTKELSLKNSAKALRIAAYIGSSAKFAMPMAVSALYTHFYRILKYAALLMQNQHPGNDQKAKVLGVNPYFFSEYDTAVRNYPVKKCMAVIALLKDYDYKGKGGDVGEATPAELMVELTARILTI